MDKFVVRTPRNSPNSSPTKRRNRSLKQATLESLKGVVVVEELQRARVVLERKDVRSELKLDTLESLLRKNPAKEVLIRTHLGKTIHQLCKCDNRDVAAMAKKVYEAWRSHILSKTNRPTIEVKCDLKTQSFRDTARRMILDVLRIGGEGKLDKGNAARKEESRLKDGEEKEKIDEGKHLFGVKDGRKKEETGKKGRREEKDKSQERDEKSRRKEGEMMNVGKMVSSRVTDREEKGRERERRRDNMLTIDDKAENGREERGNSDQTFPVCDENKNGKRQYLKGEEKGNSLHEEKENKDDHAIRKSRCKDPYTTEKPRREDKVQRDRSTGREGEVSKRKHREEGGTYTAEEKREVGSQEKRRLKKEEMVESQKKKAKEDDEDGSVNEEDNGSVRVSGDGNNNDMNAKSRGTESEDGNNKQDELREEEGRSADRNRKKDKKRDRDKKERDRRKSKTGSGRKREESERHRERGDKAQERESRREEKRSDRKDSVNRKADEEKCHSDEMRNRVYNSYMMVQKIECQAPSERIYDLTHKNGNEKFLQADKDNKLNQKDDEVGNNDNSLESLAEYIEREVYSGSRRLVSTSYRRTIRSLVFCLRHQAAVRHSILSASITVPELVMQHYKV